MRVSSRHLSSWGTLPCSSATSSGAPAGSVHETMRPAPPRARSAANAMIDTMRVRDIAKLRIRATSNAAAAAVASDVPYTPSPGA